MAIQVAARIAPSSRRAAAEKERTVGSVFYIKRADSADSLAGNALKLLPTLTQKPADLTVPITISDSYFLVKRL